MTGILVVLAVLALATFIYMQQPIFGKAPSGERLERIKQSPNYNGKKFINQSETPQLAENATFFGVLKDYFLGKSKQSKPKQVIPSVKTNLKNIPITEDVLIWFGHSSYYIQLNGKRFLVDPVLSGNASPIPGTATSFKGTDIYSVADFPAIDYLVISHDHYDHLDYKTIKQLKNKVNTVICGLGVGSHFEHWGYDASKLIEKDWNETIDLGDGLTIYTTPARHFSGRSFKSANTLWMSYVLQSPSMKIFLGGDSGYDSHFKKIGEQFGPFDLAILENGQYNKNWPYIHTLPNEILDVAKDLKAKRIFPVHSSKFVLANHSWFEPLQKISENNKALVQPFKLITPIIGEKVMLKKEDQLFKEWWLEIE